MTTATVEETRQAIDDALRTRGAPYSSYSCKKVSWDDVSRGTVGGSLSCWGANITDTYLKGRDGSSLYTVRSDNWNERLGTVRASDVTLLYGNCDNSASASSTSNLKQITLAQFLQDPHAHGASYTGLSDDIRLSSSDGDGEAGDEKVSIRFQTVFLPVEATSPTATKRQKRQTFEFATEAYNYNTMSDDDPRNLVLLATTQGLAVQADGAGAKRLLHHMYDARRSEVRQYWLEAERSDHGVGSAQVETDAEREDAERRGKATSKALGIAAMGTRFNTLMTVQVPLTPQKKSSAQPVHASMFCMAMPMAANGASAQGMNEIIQLDCAMEESSFPPSTLSLAKANSRVALGRRKFNRKSARSSSNAARVSRGTDAGLCKPLEVHDPNRNADEHVTVTVVFYNTVAGGVPSPDDVALAVDDMERLLVACQTDGRLADDEFEFMKKKLTVDDVQDITTKIMTQPPGKVIEKEAGGETNDKEKKMKIVLGKIDGLKKDHSTTQVTQTKLVTVGLLQETGRGEDVISAVSQAFDEFAAECTKENSTSVSASVDEKVTVVRLIVSGALNS